MAQKKTKQHKMTPELKEKLLGISAVTNTIKYTTTRVDEDTPDELIPVFTFRGFTVREIKEVTDQMAELPKDADLVAQLGIFDEIARTHITNWDHVVDLSSESEYVEFLQYSKDEDGTTSSDAYYSLIFGLRNELCFFVQKLLGLK